MMVSGRCFVVTLSLLLLLLVVNGRTVSASGRILGGTEANAGVYPYAVSIRIDNTHIGGGNIISNNKILTTAHSVHRNNQPVTANRLSVRVGSTNQFAGGIVVYVADVLIHPNYYDLQNNLAILTLRSPLEWTERIQPIALAKSVSDIPAVEASVNVAGWGTTIDGNPSYKIREVALRVASDDVCSNAYKAHDASTLCLAHDLKVGTCQGDGGNGAVFNKKLIGITNFIIGACGSRYPDVFVNIPHYASWIDGELLSKS